VERSTLSYRFEPILSSSYRLGMLSTLSIENPSTMPLVIEPSFAYILVYASCQISGVNIRRCSFRIGLPFIEASSIPFNLLLIHRTALQILFFREMGTD